MQQLPFCQRRLQRGAGWESVVVDMSLVPEAAWREAQRQAEVTRPLLENDHRPRHLLEVPLLKRALKLH
jgi:hypothetical protein